MMEQTDWSMQRAPKVSSIPLVLLGGSGGSPGAPEATSKRSNLAGRPPIYMRALGQQQWLAGCLGLLARKHVPAGRLLYGAQSPWELGRA